MTTTLPRGGNTALAALPGGAAGRFELYLEWGGDSPAKPAVDAVAFLLGASGKVRGDADMVFYNQLSSPDGAVAQKKLDVRSDLNCQSYGVDLSRLDPAVERIAFCLAIHEELGGVTAISQLQPLHCRLEMGGQTVLTAPHTFTSHEAAAIIAEVYKRNGEWKFRSVGQGFNAGLAALAESYGIVVAEDAQGAPEGHPTEPVSPGRSAAPAVIYAPPQTGFGEILINLTWGSTVPVAPPAPAKTGGLLGGLLGAGKKPTGALDLDLCALYELNDGYRGIVQALGGSMGNYNIAPFMELMGDAKEGSAGETIRINGVRWSEIKRVLVYAMIFEGTPNWAQAVGRASIRVKDELPVGVKLDQNTTDKRACSIALLENVGGKLAIHKRVETFKNPKELDQHYGWGLHWKAGTKD